jgi:TDG/mug DNA glycosylase family protein
MAKEKLPNQLRDGLRVVFVGTAAGHQSAKLGQYYAKPGNRFWIALHEAGITERQYEPSEFAKLVELGIGFTDMSKYGAGMDHQVAEHQYDAAGFEKKIQRYNPGAIAFTSKRAAAVWKGVRSTRRISYGKQPRHSDDFPEVFVLNSPSGAAGRYWDLEPWRALARWLAKRRKL